MNSRKQGLDTSINFGEIKPSNTTKVVSKSTKVVGLTRRKTLANRQLKLKAIALILAELNPDQVQDVIEKVKARKRESTQNPAKQS